jgi:hypothetical protein
MAIMYKAGIAVIIFPMIFRITLATQMLRQQKKSIKPPMPKGFMFIHFHYTLPYSMMSFLQRFK